MQSNKDPAQPKKKEVHISVFNSKCISYDMAATSLYFLFISYNQKCMCFSTGAKMIKHVGDIKYLAQFVPKSISIGATISLAHLKHRLWRPENVNMFSRSLMVKSHLAAKSMGC